MDTNEYTNDLTNPGSGDCRESGKTRPTYMGADPILGGVNWVADNDEFICRI